MAVTGTYTARDIVTQALQKAGLVGWGTDPQAEEAAAALVELNTMLKGWQNKGHALWTVTGGSLTLTTSAEHTLDPVRPLNIVNARFLRSGTEIPMVKMTRQEYDELPNKAATGTPTQFHYDRQKEAARLFVWPVLATASGETIEYTYQREIEDQTDMNAVIDVPGEWFDAVVYNLAARLIETVPLTTQNPLIAQRAMMLLDEALAFDREDSLFWGCHPSE